jgi:hypothetical protein
MSIRLIATVFVTTILCARAVPADERRYSQADLQALADKGAWSELIEHLGDVPPAARDARWEKVVEQAGIGALEVSTQRDDPFLGIRIGIQLVDQFPQVRESRVFMKKRNEVGLQAFDRCLNHDERIATCAPLLKAFVAQDPQDLDLAFTAGKIASKRMKRWYAASFFRTALAKPSDTRSCKDTDVRLSVVSALGLGDSPEWKTPIEDARVILRDECWGDLRNAVQDAFHEAGSKVPKNSCDILKAKSALGKVDVRVCANLSKKED